MGPTGTGAQGTGPHGGGSTAACSRRGVSCWEGAAAAAGRASNLGSAHTPVGTGTVAAAAGDSGSAPSQAPAAQSPCAEDMLLLKALVDAGINPRRVHSVRQPDPNGDALKKFRAKGIELAAAGVQRSDFVNPAGHRWVLLAMPGEDQGQQYAEAARFFQPGDLGVNVPSEVCLASAEYSGVCVLAEALLGSGLSSYADGFESRDQSKQQPDDFWIKTSAAFSRAPIRSYQFTRSACLTGIAAKMAPFQPPPNLETVSRYLEKIAQTRICIPKLQSSSL